MIKKLFSKQFVLFYLMFFAFFTCSYVVLSFAKYSYTRNDTKTMNVAKFDVSYVQIESSDTINIIADNSLFNYRFKVKNSSEVGIKYSLVVSNIPEGVKVSLDNGTLQTPSNGVVIFENASSIDYVDGGAYRDHTLSFSSIPEVDDSISNLVNLNILVSQKKPN